LAGWSAAAVDEAAGVGVESGLRQNPHGPIAEEWIIFKLLLGRVTTKSFLFQQEFLINWSVLILINF